MDVGLQAPEASSNNAFGTSHKKGKVIEMPADFTPGFKVGAAYSFSKTNWSFFSEYTRLDVDQSVTRHEPSGGLLYAHWIQPDLIFNNASTKLSTHWDLKVQLLNFEVGSPFFAGTKLEVRPHFGLGAAWFDQKIRGKYSLISPEILLQVENKSDSWAVGPRAGLDLKWHVLPYFSFVGNVASEILFTRYDLSLHQEAKDDSTVFLNSGNHVNAIRPELELYLGLSTSIYFSKRCCWLKLDAGYDFQVWWNQNMLRPYNDFTYIATPEGNLAFQGLRATASFGF